MQFGDWVRAHLKIRSTSSLENRARQHADSPKPRGFRRQTDDRYPEARDREVRLSPSRERAAMLRAQNQNGAGRRAPRTREAEWRSSIPWPAHRMPRFLRTTRVAGKVDRTPESNHRVPP